MHPLRTAALLASLLSASTALAQTAPAAADSQRCATVSDTARVLTPQQVRDRRRLGMQLDTLIRRSGQTEPVLVMVDQDSARRDIHVLDAVVDSATVRAVQARVERYLSTVPRNRPFQTLLRPGMETPVLAARKAHCTPELDNASDINDLKTRMMLSHPLRASVEPGRRVTALVRMVVNRDGGVSWLSVLRPSGDAYVDANVEEIAARMQFLPATLDGAAFDSFVTYPLIFTFR